MLIDAQDKDNITLDQKNYIDSIKPFLISQKRQS